MVTVEMREFFRCTPERWLDFVLDVEHYAEVDDKLGPIAWVRRQGDLTEFKFIPRLPGLPVPPLPTVSQMRLTPGQRIDVQLAPFPRNPLSRLTLRFHASFSCRPVDDGIEVTRMLSFQFTPLVRPLVEPTLRRTLPGSVRRELDLSKHVLETG